MSKAFFKKILVAVIVACTIVVLLYILVPAHLKNQMRRVEAKIALISDLEKTERVRVREEARKAMLTLYERDNLIAFPVHEFPASKAGPLLEKHGFTRLLRKPNDPDIWWVRSKTREGAP